MFGHFFQCLMSQASKQNGHCSSLSGAFRCPVLGCWPHHPRGQAHVAHDGWGTKFSPVIALTVGISSCSDPGLLNHNKFSEFSGLSNNWRKSRPHYLGSERRKKHNNLKWQGRAQVVKIREGFTDWLSVFLKDLREGMRQKIPRTEKQRRKKDESTWGRAIV